ncbi:MAG: HypC/HybG/HupF family hydrogenase formation chaperone [Candidatus Tectimicrobiota bacterium]
MCLAIPGRIVDIYEEQGLRMGTLDFGGTCRRCCLHYLPEVAVGDYALVHVGFAISQVNEAEALRTYQLLQDIEDVIAELDAAAPELPGEQGEAR